MPARAAEVQAQAASRPNQPADVGLEHARLAFQRMRSTGDPEASAKMLERMRALYPKDTGLLTLAIQVAEEHDVRRAFDLAKQLVAIAPAEAGNHRLVARLAEANGRGLRALDEYVWLVRHGGTQADRARALALAKQNWDLRLYRQLLETSSKPEGPKSERACPHDGG